jgi:type II secretory pathway component PulJ
LWNFPDLLIILATEQKEKLSAVEQQLKRAEALQRRRMQVEKANRESEVCPVNMYFFS